MSAPLLRTDLAHVFRLRAFVKREDAERVRTQLRALGGVRHVMVSDDPGQQTILVSADVDPPAADRVLSAIHTNEIPTADLSLSRDEEITVGGDAPAGRPELAWAAVLGEARANARPLARYLLLMTIAGVIAAFGVIDRNEILIVGAMAVSPDLLPLCAACVGIEARRWTLAARSVRTLLVGLGASAVVAAVLTLVLDATGWLAEEFRLGGGGIGTLARIDLSTVVVAGVAGIAAMLAFETRASAAVGVAISVTTIPAAAYAGVSAGLGEWTDASRGLGVLAVNLVALQVMGTATLIVQRRLNPQAPRAGLSPPA